MSRKLDDGKVYSASSRVTLDMRRLSSENHSKGGKKGHVKSDLQFYR